MKRFLFPVVFLVGAFLAAGSPAFGRGYDFRNFADNPPRVGEKAPDFASIDEDGKPVALKDRIGESHLVLVFGALT